MERKQTILLAAVSAAAIAGMGFLISEDNKRKAIVRADNLAQAEECLKNEEACDSAIKLAWLPEDIKGDVSKAVKAAQIRKSLIAKAKRCVAFKSMSSCEAINRKEVASIDPELAKDLNDAIWSAKQKEAEAKRKEQERIAREKREKAEWDRAGWWEQKPGIFVRWCSKVPCPGPRGNGYSDYVWRAMVWCKERACGDIYAKLNIERNGVVVGWTNDTAYGGYGQKVVLMFGSSTQGSGRLVEFKTY